MRYELGEKGRFLDRRLTVNASIYYEDWRNILPSYDLINMRRGVKFRNTWTATLFVNNLTNKHAQLVSLFQENEPQPSFTRYITNQPLTGGVDLTYRF